MLDNLNKYRIILGSASPRRKELLAGLGLSFDVKPMPDLDESYPSTLGVNEIPLYIACQKAEAYVKTLADNELLITADTIVWLMGKVLGKPSGREEAIRMLQMLSVKTHEVITGVCMTTKEKRQVFSVSSMVHFHHLSQEDILYYVDTYKPYDKAGAYGIQEWIGYIGVEAIEGSFFNVMGLPVQRLYQELKKF
ncbi:MAG: Maf-like protein [Tannerellaceae bacterium]|nr:Maf-like protein [Tannerellaceae bacterium]